MENLVEVDAILNSLIYIFSGALYLAIFLWLYLKLTPYDDFKLIREGNSAAAISLTGALIGFVLPLSRAIEQSASLVELLIWALVTLITQTLVYLVMKKIFPNLVQQIPQNRNGEAIFLAGLSIAVGLLTAASITG